LLERAFTQEPSDYLEGSVEQTGETETQIEHSLEDFGPRYFNYGVELSAPCRGIAVRHPKLELLLEPTLSVCCFRYVSPRVEDLDGLNQPLHRRLLRENVYLPSTTRVRGQLALRPCFIGALAEAPQVDGLLQAVLRIGDALVDELA
jgi:aromatic-L-amino-acid decarboxylase